MNDRELGLFIRKSRKKFRIKQHVLAKELGIADTSLSKIEFGIMTNWLRDKALHAFEYLKNKEMEIKNG